MWFCCVICPKGSEGQSEEPKCSWVGLPLAKACSSHHPDLWAPAAPAPNSCSRKPQWSGSGTGSRRHLKGWQGK